MKSFYKMLFCIIILASNQYAKGQDTLRIENVVKVSKGQTLEIKAGTIVLFSPGAKIWVEGSISIKGTPSNEILLLSQNSSNPGTGIFINGLDLSGSVQISNATFDGLIQPLSFEPFWARKNVLIDNITIKNSKFNEFVLFVSTPLCNQNIEPISFKLINSKFFNNKSGVIIDNIGISGIEYEFDNLVFQENYVEGEDPSIGIFALNIASPFNSKNLNLGSLAFNKNKAGDATIGLSVSGSSENIAGKYIYHEGIERPVYDYLIDPRLPSVNAKSKDLSEWPAENCFYSNIIHFENSISIPNAKTCQIKAILDSIGNNLEYAQEKRNDSLIINYNGGVAQQMVSSTGVVIQLPKQEFAPQDSTMPDSLTQEIIEQQIDTLIEEPKFTFKPSFEVGALGGLAFYVGDIKHRFGIPGTYEWSGGGFLQYNRKENWSYRATFYRTNIGMHDPTGPLQLFQANPTYVTKNKAISQRSSWENNFITKMYIVDFDAIYYFAPRYNLMKTFKNNGPGFWIPAFGFGMGFMKYDPYRNLVYTRFRDSAVLMALRPLGMEGQNFLKGKKAYGNYTVNLNISIQLSYIYKNFRIRYELKSVLSMSDYIDDYGQGYTYGGNYAKWKSANGITEMPYNNSTGKQLVMEKVFPEYNTTIKRTGNLLPDMFFQQHIGISYDLGSLFIKKKK